MEQRISLITLGVADVGKSRRFYEKLGWKASSASEEAVVFFQLGGMALGLYGRDALAEDAKLPPGGSGFGGITLAYNVRQRQDVDRILEEAQQAGGKLLKPAQDVFWGGYSGYFADPDGHPWEVAWNPGFALGEDGSLTLPA
ncbi:MAG: VOC family protein [Phycisphaerales bacterium]|nr:VOC family protein [Phycisphaerales bacterium]